MALKGEKAKRIKERLENKYSSFLPCNISQEKIIEYEINENYGDIIDFIYSKKSEAKDMEAALLYPKHASNIDFIVKRISEIFSEPLLADKIKEQYYLEAVCNEEMLGVSAFFYYKWYKAALSYCDSVQNKTSIQETFNSYKEVINSGLEYAGNNMKNLFSEILDIYFLEYAENKDSKTITELLTNPLFQTFDFTSDIYKNMVKTGFQAKDFNPEKMILDEWDNSEYSALISNIAYKFGLKEEEVIDLLIEKNKINITDVIDNWEKGKEIDEIKMETGFQAKEVQYILKKNSSKLNRKEDLYKLDWYYDFDDEYDY